VDDSMTERTAEIKVILYKWIYLSTLIRELSLNKGCQNGIVVTMYEFSVMTI